MQKIEIAFVLIILIISSSSCKKVEKSYYPNGKLKSEIEFRFGKENGQAIYYDDYNPLPQLVVAMKDGKRNGSMTRYFFNGNYEINATYVDDILEGQYTEYYLEGGKSLECNYLHGKKNGDYITYHDNGIIKEKGAFSNDLFHGEWEYFDERGFSVGEGTFDNGTGTQTAYDANGNMMRFSHYVDNMKDGDEIYFSPTQDTIEIITFDADRIQKVRKF